MEGWRTIETAPRNGQTVLAYFPTQAGRVARQDVVAVYWTGWGGGRWETAWSGAKLNARPSHWMPLPDPPQEPR